MGVEVTVACLVTCTLEEIVKLLVVERPDHCAAVPWAAGCLRSPPSAAGLARLVSSSLLKILVAESIADPRGP